MKRSERLARHYVRASDLRAIFLASRGSSVRIGVTRDPSVRTRALKDWKVQELWWCSTDQDAARLIEQMNICTSGLCGDQGDASLAKLGDLLAALATNSGITIADDATVQARATAVAKDIEQRVNALQISGHLRGFNSDYKARRAAAARRGVPFISYGEHLARYQIRMLYEIAELMRAPR